MPTSPNLLIEHIVQSQSQKEVTANTAFNDLETAITEVATLAVGGTGTYTLSLAEMRNAILECTGTLTGARNIVVPNRDKLYIVDNQTSGAFTLSIKTSAGGSVVVEQGFKSIVYCDGTDVLALSGVPLNAYRTVTATSDTARITDRTIFIDCTSNNVTITLPAASTALGWRCRFIRIDSSGNTATVQRNGSDDINNAATSKTITNTIGAALDVIGATATRFMAQTLTAA